VHHARGGAAYACKGSTGWLVHSGAPLQWQAAHGLPATAAVQPDPEPFSADNRGRPRQAIR